MKATTKDSLWKELEKDTEALEIPGVGCLVKSGNAMTHVPGVRIQETKDGDKVTGHAIVPINTIR